jgi:tetratricopeptide (TPR) repeat protein
MRTWILFAAGACLAWGQAGDRAYEALRAKEYDRAVLAFREAIAAEPRRTDLRKDFAYTLLKIGENEEARDQFAEVVKIDQKDVNSTLEYAFLSYETGLFVEARRAFDSLRKENQTAAQAFENIDRPLREEIERWQRAVEMEPGNFSAQRELAELAERRDEPALAAQHYEAAWHLRPEKRELMIPLARMWKQSKREEDATALLLAASRGTDTRTAERARALLPSRYPWVREFEAALQLDPANVDLRREFAFLLLAMNRKEEGEAQLRKVLEHAPGDPVAVAQIRGTATVEAKTLGMRSLEKSYLPDALRYLTIAHESDPADGEVMLKLGYANNLLRHDREALQWFSLAAKSGDEQAAREARRAYRNLAPDVARIRTTVWVLPFYSTRWSDVFAYAQAKAEFRTFKWRIRPYLSVRFDGDAQGGGTREPGVLPAQLSEHAVLLAAGLSAPLGHGWTGWVESGGAFQYAGVQPGRSGVSPDTRGGFAYGKGWGRLLGTTSHGWFAETTLDAVYFSAFQNDAMGVSQNRGGWTFKAWGERGLQAQALVNVNLTVDALSQYWANFVEAGPGVRLRWSGLPPGLRVGADWVRGVYLRNEGNPGRPNFFDFRVGAWYAFTR